MPARHRERENLNGKGGSSFYYLANPQTSVRVASEGITQTCDDVVGNYPRPNPLDLSTIHTYHPVLDGRLLGGGGALLRELIAYPIDYHPSPSDPRESFPFLDEVDRSNVGWQLLAKTNVSLPHVDLPSFLAELPEFVSGVYAMRLREIPKLVKEYGSNLMKAAAAGHLTWRWAIKPMVSDIRTMLNFMDAVERRERVLENLLVSKSVKRKAGLGNSHVDFPETEVFLHSSTGATIKAKRKVTHSSSMWGSVKWKLIGDGGIPTTEAGRRNAAYLQTLGITSRGALQALWEITPWSWFIDWFAGLGTILAATDNTIPMTWSENCVMRKSRSDTRFELLPGSWQDWCTISGMPVEIHERKERYLCAPILPFIPSLQPLVDLKAWSILGSLAALKSLRR